MSKPNPRNIPPLGPPPEGQGQFNGQYKPKNQSEEVIFGSTQNIPKRRAPPIPPPATDINERIRTVLGNEKYNEQLHSITDPDYVCEPTGNPNDCVNVANDYIKVAGNISKIDQYGELQGVKNSVNTINIAIDVFNKSRKLQSTNKATIIQGKFGGGKRKRNKKIGTKKKQYKRK